MDSEGHHQDDPIIVTMFEGSSDNDALWEERNTLAVALRRIAHRTRCEKVVDSAPDSARCRFRSDMSPLADSYVESWCDPCLAMDALTSVFAEDPLGQAAIYHCPDAHGVNRLREELDRG